MDIDAVKWIIARFGGADGTAMLHENSEELLNKQGLKVSTTTGLIETEFGLKEDNYNPEPEIIPELSFSHSKSEELFNYSFKEKKRNKEKWIAEHNYHKEKIKDRLEDIVGKNNGSPIIIHNLLSLREFHPQAATALKEVIKKYPETNFISYAADSSFERSERTSRIKDYVLDEIKGTTNGKDSLGPYDFENLYHIVLNKKQEKTFNKDYNIPSEKVFRLPDFLPFQGSIPTIKEEKNNNFLDYLSSRATRIGLENKLEYAPQDIGDDPTILLSPVRPIERKKIKTSIFLASQYQKKNNKRTSVVITHPNKDEGGNYFNECVMLANKLDVPLIYLGEDMRLNSNDKMTLWDIYQNLSPLKTVSMILSSKGGWENAINESIKYCIPTYVNPSLPSYKEILDMGIKIFGRDLNSINYLIENKKPEELQNTRIDSIGEILDWIETYSSGPKRKELVTQSYIQGYKNLSSQARTPQFMKILQKTYNRPK